MKFFVASDIHGDSYWAQRVIDAFTESKADKLVLLGDILYHGPRNNLPANYEPKKVIELFNNIANKIIAVRGNCDTEVDQMVLKFPILADYIYLVDEGTVFFVTHGHIYNPMNLPAVMPEGKYLISIVIQKFDYFLGFVMLRKIVPRTVVKNIAQQYELICLALNECVDNALCPI